MIVPLGVLWIFTKLLTNAEASYRGTVGYECNEGAKCLTANSECRFDRCFCKDGYSTVFPKTVAECSIFPALGQPCTASTDSRRSSCMGDHVVCINGTCACDMLYERRNGSCVPSERSLLERCSADEQCLTPFTECYHGKCACRDGFTQSERLCIPKDYYCAVGEQPLRTRDSIHYCTLYNDGRHTCPNGSYCVPLIKWQTSPLCKVTAKVRGFCCSIPAANRAIESACPVGRPLRSNVNCQQLSTHYVYINKYAKENLCCPNACPDQYLYHEGRCIRNRLPPSSDCEIDLQCTCGYCRRQRDGEKRCECIESTMHLYGKCYAPSCFYGDAAVDAATNMTKRCSKTSPQCPENFICYMEFGLCCPRMPIHGMR
uniref:EB domain-containing protein n=1 Tax=Trichuris muris TaxID=70415 RepID=A0A5S6QCU4_TRIMR